uniref:Uncharacterized protein n=1 Tax=candidate division WOR-3 bacterium TaxID=2052148 RepID=A0A7C4TB54_UNCW3
MEIFGIAMGFFSVALAAVGIIFAINLSKRTDRLIEREDARAKEMIEKGNERVERIIQEGNERVERIIQEGNERLERIIQEGEERLEKLIQEGRRETKELIRYISSLIAAEGEKTRKLIAQYTETTEH